ncbi:MAG: hypothetical protein IKQ35_01545 [Bacilli bacterium]|nr:hypothetical protein [Bacilli bacterium]
MSKDKRKEIHEEGIPDGVTITSRKDNNIKKTIGKKIVFCILLATLISGYLIENSTLVDRGQSVAYVVSEESNRTVLDEAVASHNEEYNDDLLARIDSYRDLIKISERLNSYNLDEVIRGLTPLDMNEQLDVVALKENMNKYDEYVSQGENGIILSKDSEDFLTVALMLERDERSVNALIHNRAFADLADLKLLALKSKVADCCEFGPESIGNMKLQEIDGERVITYQGNTGRIYTVRFADGGLDFITSSKLVPRIMNSVFDDQSYSESVSTDYDHNTNNLVLDEINDLTTFIKMDCSINHDGKLQLSSPVAIQRLTHTFKSTEKKEN